MKRRHPGAFFFLALAIAAACSILPAAAVFAQDTAASAATARGFEGLEYNPAAVAAGRSEAVGFGAVWAGSGGQEYGFKAVFSDSLILDYQRSGSEEELKLLYALAFPRESAFH
ncbi:MAG: hypothetical protein JXB06_12800, partial [Spirochaetales bacterium]|nr:hypothetical protein [Spirochaetales bacterium]